MTASEQFKNFDLKLIEERKIFFILKNHLVLVTENKKSCSELFVLKLEFLIFNRNKFLPILSIGMKKKG